MGKFYENEVRYAGLLARDASLKGEGKSAFASNALAIRRSWKDKSGEWQEATTWIKFKCFGYTAEKLAKCKKGDNVYIKGETEDTVWLKDGEEVKSQEVKAFHLSLIPKEEKREEAPQVAVEDEDDLPW